MGVGNYYSDQYTDVYVDVPPDKVPASLAGKVRALYATVESATATGLDSGSTLTMFRPPAGWRFYGGEIWSDNLTNSTTLAVGTGATKFARSGVNVNWADQTPAVAVTAAFGAATDHGSAATKTLLGLAAGIDVIGYEFDGATNVVVTTGTGAMATGATITLVMFFIAS
jgi:hypothetical protein